jgi:hypothetical protein
MIYPMAILYVHQPCQLHVVGQAESLYPWTFHYLAIKTPVILLCENELQYHGAIM